MMRREIQRARDVAMPEWDGCLSAQDLEMLALSGYGGRSRFGQRPLLLIIDATYKFLGDQAEPIQKSVQRFPHSCGEKGWLAVERIKRLLSFCRNQGVPVAFTARDIHVSRGRWAEKHPRTADGMSPEKLNAVVEEIAPLPGEKIIEKSRPSAFFHTSFLNFLKEQGIDTLLVTGCTTSGCVRATVVDAFSHGFINFIVEECVFDRFEISHRISLFDMHAKYGDVVSLEECLTLLSSRTLQEESR